MTELEKIGLVILFIIQNMTIVWATLMIHKDFKSIWKVDVEIRELLKKNTKE